MKTVVVFSGGLDSTVLAAKCLAAGEQVYLLSVDYGQRHRVELEHAGRVADALGAEHKIINLAGLALLMRGSSQTDPSVKVPHGHYEEESMKDTVVPNRNMVLLAMAGAWAVSLKADSITYGAHSGDHAIYPDCREEFVAAMASALSLADWHQVTLRRPFIGMSKADVVQLGASLGAPMGMTWSCYEGGFVHCGRCGTCVERREAFLLAGVPDPTDYLA